MCNDVCFSFSVPEDKQQLVGDPSLHVFIDKNLQDGNGLIIGVQHLKKFFGSDTIIGVFSIDIISNNRWFAINKSTLENDQSKLKGFYRFVKR